MINYNREEDNEWVKKTVCKLFIILTLICFDAVVLNSAIAENTVDVVQGLVKTVYDITGRPVNQSEDAKGFHRVADSVTLTAGSAQITLNTSTADGKQDVSFIGSSTYNGSAWTTDSTSNNTYKVYPLTSYIFKIKSYDSTGSFDATDVSTVYYRLEGE